MKRFKFQLLALPVIGCLSLYSCEDENPIEDDTIDKEVFDPNSALNTIFDGKIFSIPSPVQTAYLIKNLDLSFDASLGNDVKNVGEYVTEYQQSLNLGVYGADLGYSALYDQKNITLQYLSVVQNLTNQLGLDAAFSSEFLENFEMNSENEQEMIQLMSEAFKQADNFLKHANRKQTSALILTGGWIESINFACQLNAKNPSDKIKRRIGEQKQTIGSIIDILREYNSENQNDTIIKQLEELKLSFDKVMITYEFVAPDTDQENKLTNLRHKSEVIIEDSVINEIENKIKTIRSSIIKV
tara:strand:+ start:3908 stop:4804 length:897 start_codon:yes stop_codon:yes gene_type:complete